jgi:hypothetical protein
MTVPAEVEALGPERLPDGRTNEVRFQMVQNHLHHATSGMLTCQNRACQQYRELLAGTAAMREALEAWRRFARAMEGHTVPFWSGLLYERAVEATDAALTRQEQK